MLAEIVSNDFFFLTCGVVLSTLLASNIIASAIRSSRNGR
jgi:hypothetical protein